MLSFKMLPYHGWMSAPVAPVMVGQGPATEKARYRASQKLSVLSKVSHVFSNLCAIWKPSWLAPVGPALLVHDVVLLLLHHDEDGDGDIDHIRT